MSERTSQQKFLQQVLPLVWRVYHGFRSIAGSRSIGVQAMLFDEQDRILLVRHTYNSGWYLPGGGVKRGEDVLSAVKREIREEVYIDAKDLEMLPALFLSSSGRRSDYVAVFKVKDWSRLEKIGRNWEIAESKFFELGELPDDLNPGARRRIQEYQQGSTEFVW